jgi:CHASE2 domain-containing sensor protein
MQRLKQLGTKLEAWSHKLPIHKLDVAISLVVTLAGLLLYVGMVWTRADLPVLSFLEDVELRSLDARFQARGQVEHDPRIVIIGIDENTLQKIGAWPISRKAYADLVDKLHGGGARVIGMDVTFPCPRRTLPSRHCAGLKLS